MGCEVSTLLTRVSLPAEDKNIPFQPGSRAPILSIIGWTSILRSLRVRKGSPKYFPGNDEILPVKSGSASATISSVQRIGKISILSMFTVRPEHSPKTFNKLFM
jgi:hypothetical protein